jgi:hypothetical protein
MTKRMTIVFAVTACLVLAGAVVYFHRTSQRQETGTAGAPPDLMSLLPKDAPAVFYVDATALRGSQFVVQAIAAAPAVKEDVDYQRFVAQSGFDYTKDLDHVAGAVWPGVGPARLVAIAEGRFDQKKIVEYALRSGTASQAGATTIYKVKLQDPKKTVELAFLGPTLLALAEGMELDGVLKAQTSAADMEIAAHVQGVAGSAFFAVARAGELRKATAQTTSGAAQLNQILDQVEFLSLVAEPKGDNLDMAVEADCKTAGNALRLSTLIEGLRWMGRAALADPGTRRRMGKQNAQAADLLLRTAEVSHKLHSTTIHLELTPVFLRASLIPAPAPRR